MEEDIKILEDVKRRIKIDTQAPNVALRNRATRQMHALENLIKGYRELEEKNKRYEKIYREYGIDDLVAKINELEEFKKQVTEIESTNFIKYKNYIPKSKIKEKIEELRNKLTWGYIDWKYDEKVYMAEHNMLDEIEKELMEDK